ncbi:MAG: hypothetical protein IPL46_30140 [Saprospiraceae bacterium]|nr:hypothetical protein [Saprospiraceae bacterium]
MKFSFHFSSFALMVFLISCSQVSSQEHSISTGDSVGKGFHIALDDFPSNMVINHIEGWGGMTVAVNEMPAGSDLGPLLAGLKNNSCQVPHWGYIIKGVLRMKYDNGREDLLKAGELFYMPPGHVGVVEEDLKLMDFSPQEGMKEVIAHIEKKIAESQK